ncbi:MAG: tetratricopeptide repeat protein [Proteobacteria bacterium]|nr:tetratricopeptide repeat protein [Pseudomonadota bacterium]
MRYFGLRSIVMASLIVFGGGQAYAQSHYATKQAQENYDNGIKLERQAEEKGDVSYYEQAEKEYRSAINAEPNMVSAYIRLGYVLYVQKKSEAGIEILQKGLSHHSDNVELKHYLGLNLYQAGRTEDAEVLLNEVVSTRKDLSEAYFVLGKISLDKGDSLKAQEYFEQYASATPNDVQAFRALSSAYIQAKDIAGAEATLARLLELAPDDVIAKINMGHVKYERGQTDEAVKLYEQAYKLDPRRSELLYTIASVYYLGGRYEEAIQRFAVVLEKDRTHMSAQYFTADSELKLGHLDKAEVLFKALEAEMPDYKYIKLKLAYIRMLRGESGAVDDVRKLMNNTTNPDDLHFGAVMLRKQGYVDESVAVHRKLRDDHMDQSIYGVYLAREYMETGNYVQASELLMLLIDESVNNSLAWEMMSITLLHQGIDAMMMGEFEQARSYFDQALSMEVHTVQAYCSFSQLALLEGNMEEAYQSFQMAEQISPDDPNVIKLAAQFDIMDGKNKYAVQRLNDLKATQSASALGGAGWYLMAVAQSSIGQWDEAAQSLEEAEKMGVVDSPASAVVALQGAMKAYDAGDYSKLDRQLERVERFKEGLDTLDRIRYDYLQALSSIRSKKYTQAKAALEAVQSGFGELDPDSRRQIVDNGKLDVSYELAYVYYETGNLDAALSALGTKTSAERRTLEAAVRRKLGYQALKNHKYDTALDNYNRLNALGNPSNSDQYNQVLAKLQAKKLSDAGDVLEKYAKQNIPEAVLNYAIYLDGVGSGERATQYYEKYVSLASSRKSEDVRRMLATKQRVWGGE